MNNSLIWFLVFVIFIVSLFFIFRLFIQMMNQEKRQINDKRISTQENILSGEPDFIKANVTPEGLGAQFIKWLQTDPPPIPANLIAIDRFTTEYVYLQTFTYDLAAYLKLGDTYEKKVILDVFWDYITGAGVYTETFQLRMLRYTDAVKEASTNNIHELLGYAFAEICGTPGNESIINAGANTVKFITNRINQLFDHVSLDMTTVNLSTFLPE